jgi:hypothetical protein
VRAKTRPLATGPSEGVRPSGGSRDHIAAEIGREHGLIEDGHRIGWRDIDPRQGNPVFDDWTSVVEDDLGDL